MRARLQAILAAIALALAVAACSEQAPPPPAKPQEAVSTEQSANPYPDAAYVRLLINDRGHDAQRERVFSNPGGRRLSQHERANFEKALRHVTVVSRPPPDPNGEVATDTACFIPHHFFKYFDAKGREVGEIAVCFCCQGAEASPRLPFENSPNDYLHVDVPAIGQFVVSLGLPTRVGCDES